jgi:predicted TIM-barrel fold metal-dependent hydrolase
MIIDCHCHIFTKQVIQHVTSKVELVKELELGVDVEYRSEARVLDESARDNNVDHCILLPTASPDKVRSENERYLSISDSFPRLRTLATLHPQMNHLADEAGRMFDRGIPGFKFSSFSQRFDLASVDVEKMLIMIKDTATRKKKACTIVLDTFNRADIHFGAQGEHLTTPAKLNAVVSHHPDIRFLAAHMGGLSADFHHTRFDLKPASNLYLDTSNAAHTLSADQFIDLLQRHGADHILFVTDWPWFDHVSEIPLIDSLLDQAGFGPDKKEAVFRKNAEILFLNHSG